MTWSDLPVLVVTGASGRVGRMLLPSLSERFRVHSVDRVRSESPRAPHTTTVADVRDPGVLAHAFRGADALLHLAANPDPTAAWNQALDNADTTHAALHAARQASIGHIAIASSVHAGGGHFRARRVPVSPYETARACCDYGVGKLAGEAVARLHHDYTGASVRVLRFGLTAASPTSRGDARTWLGDRDAADLVIRALQASPGFGIYHGVSRYAARYWSVDSAAQDLGWEPREALPVRVGPLPPHGPSSCAMFR